MSPTEIHAAYLLHLADQSEAHDRELDRKATPFVWAFLAVMAVVGLYAVLASAGILPAAEWSALGKVRR